VVKAVKLDRRIESEGDFYRLRNHPGKASEDKKSGLKVVTLIATLNPVSQVLW
jgi:hypothetical protein